MNKTERLQHGIHYQKSTDSYLVNIGQRKNFSFPTYEDAKKFRDELYADRLRMKIEKAKMELLQRENEEIAKYPSYPFNAMQTAGVENGDESLFETFLADCSEKEADMIELHFQHGETLEEIGKKYGVSRERIRQVINKGLLKIRHRYHKYPDIEKAREERRKFEEDMDALNRYRETLIEEFREKGIYTKDMEIEFGPVLSKKRAEIGLPSMYYEPIEELDLSVRSTNCLRRAGVQYVSDILDKTEDQLMHVRNLGKKSYKEIINVLAAHGLSLRKDEE